MRIGILGGTGPAGRGLAARFASVGLDVVIGSRSAERAEEICSGVKARWPDRQLSLAAGDNAAAADTDLVIVATPWEGAAPTVASVSDLLDGKVVVCMANALFKVGDEFQPLISPRGSVAHAVQAKLSRSYVTAAFQHLPARELADLNHQLGADVLVCSDFPSATEATIDLIGKIPGLRGLDAGTLGNAGSLESFVAVLLEVNVRYKAHASIRITGVD